MPDDEPQCPECGAVVRVFQRFCGSCGESMTWEVGEGQEPPRCPQCKEPVEVYQEKCDRCGMVMNWDPADTGQMASSAQKPPEREPQRAAVEPQQAGKEPKQFIAEKPKGGGSSAKRAGATIFLVIVAVVVLAWAFPYLLPSTPNVRVAVYNECDTDTLDVKVYVDNVLQRHTAIYNGYWADFGTYSVPEGTKISVEATPETSLTKSRDYIISGNTDIAVIVNNYYAETSDYPDSTIVPLSAPFNPHPPTTITPTLLLQVDYERSDWDTTNVGEVDHLVYVLSVEPWADGKLTLTLLDYFGSPVYTVTRDFTSYDVDVDSVTFAYEIYLPGDPYDAESYYAIYELAGGETVTDSGYISGPY